MGTFYEIPTFVGMTDKDFGMTRRGRMTKEM